MWAGESEFHRGPLIPGLHLIHSDVLFQPSRLPVFPLSTPFIIEMLKHPKVARALQSIYAYPSTASIVSKRDQISFTWISLITSMTRLSWNEFYTAAIHP